MLTISIGYRQPDSLSPSLRLRDVYGVSFSLATTSHPDTFDKTFAMRAHAIGVHVAEQLATQRRIAWPRRCTTRRHARTFCSPDSTSFVHAAPVLMRGSAISARSSLTPTW